MKEHKDDKVLMMLEKMMDKLNWWSHWGWSHWGSLAGSPHRVNKKLNSVHYDYYNF